MPTQYSITAAIVLGLYLTIMIFKWLSDRSAEKKKAIEDEDKKIDSFSDADSIMRDGN